MGVDSADLNCDGLADLLVTSYSQQQPEFFRNLSPGGIFEDYFDGKKHYLERNNGRGYQSHYAKRLHFGLGQLKRIDRIEVLWPGKQHLPTVIENVSVNQFKTIVEGL